MDEEGYFSLIGDDRSLLKINSQENGNSWDYSGYMTEYMQTLYEIKDNDLRYKYYGLIAFDPSFGKSANRAIFHKNNIKLKLYYTVPTTENQ
ncbi:MAG: hypothetical protein HC811_08865 [Flammeovirgaceae bacterium]|nr:hypothetical protein [Flammeovirgaceae bacterium]